MDEKVKFCLEHIDILNEPIIPSFLKQKKNYQIFIEALQHPSQHNHNILDEEFKKFYKKIRIIKYINSLINIASVDFDKKIRKERERIQLVLDAPIVLNQSNEVASKVDYIPGPLLLDVSDECLKASEDLREYVVNKRLYYALSSLTEKQITILNYIYSKGFTMQEIANQLGETRQNISNIHQKSIEKLKNMIIS
ncbi:sigma-70 family RNA polymerase sigma factor [Bacillus clarus]|uniref:RNA polymerase sigma factor sigO n=1 Tax=Bacillus clarus TaxID=2338372 RepID=A0A090ZBZ4_9BACI|nr:sigma-70 family RNA polymerase sigma factor [Bacillus clarus]KFN01826.1 RNA polymerase sigma factor sigO [Bacillus clarus]RFT66221.1 sigma-70 family RNA polymerase sigma factor [Bacillus clarus]